MPCQMSSSELTRARSGGSGVRGEARRTRRRHDAAYRDLLASSLTFHLLDLLDFALLLGSSTCSSTTSSSSSSSTLLVYLEHTCLAF